MHGLWISRSRMSGGNDMCADYEGCEEHGRTKKVSINKKSPEMHPGTFTKNIRSGNRLKMEHHHLIRQIFEQVLQMLFAQN